MSKKYYFDGEIMVCEWSKLQYTPVNVPLPSGQLMYLDFKYPHILSDIEKRVIERLDGKLD